MVDVKQHAVMIGVALSLAFTACSTPPPPSPPLKPAPQSPKVSLVEPKGFEARLSAEIFDDLTGTLMNTFGTIAVVPSLEQAISRNPKVVVFLSVTSDPATDRDTVATVDVEASFLDPHGARLDQFHLHTKQVGGPIQVPHEVNEGVRAQTRVKLQQAILGSPKLAPLVKVRPGPAKVLPSQPRPHRDSPVTLVSDIDKPGYQLDESPQSFALIVGIERYADLTTASFATRDADAVWQHLRALGVPIRNIEILTQQNATRENIRTHLTEWLPSKVKSDGTVFFYFAGHGALDPETREAYLVPWDGDTESLKTTTILLKEVQHALASLPGNQALMVLDCSFSGAGHRSVPGRNGRPSSRAGESRFLSSPKTVLFAAAGRDQMVHVLENQGHGLFTYFFLKGLSGGAKDKAGAVTLKGLYQYVKPLVEDVARRQHGNQTPGLYGLQRDQVIVRFQ